MTTDQSLPILDDPSRMQLVDRRNMLRIVDELPEQCETAMSIGRNFIGPAFDTAPDGVYLVGSGDNSLACEMAGLILAEYAGVPVSIGRLGPLPRFVGASSLAVLVDYHGKSPEAVKTYEELSARGVKTICITSGGKLSERASAGGSKLFKIPPGQPVRSALGYLVVPIIASLSACGLAPGAMEKLSAAILLLKNAREEFRFSRPTAKNVAKQGAECLFNKQVYILGAGEPLAAVARRWKTQINQNSKTPASSSNLMDEVAGPISGMERPVGVNEWAVVLLRAEHETSDATIATDATEEVLKSFTILQAKVKGRTNAERILYGAYYADYVSCYLALLYEVNPSITEYAELAQEIIINATEATDAETEQEAK